MRLSFSSFLVFALLCLRCPDAFTQVRTDRIAISALKREIREVEKKMRNCPFAPDSARCDLWSMELQLLKKDMQAFILSANSDSSSGNMLPEVEVRQKRKMPVWLQPVDTIRKQKARFFLIRAEEALEKEFWLDAHRYINEALSLYPGFYEARLMRADLDARRLEFEAALRGYAICIALFPDKPSSHYNLGQLYLRLNKKPRAMECFNEAIRLDRSYILGYMARASLNMDQGRYQEALSDLDAVLVMNPRFVFAYKTRGVARLLLQDYVSAIQDFDEYLIWTDSDAYVFMQRGLAKVLSGNLVEGCLDFARAEEEGSGQAADAIKKYCR